MPTQASNSQSASTPTNVRFTDFVPPNYRVQADKVEAVRSEAEKKLDLFLESEAQTIEHTTRSNVYQQNALLSYFSGQSNTLVKSEARMIGHYMHRCRRLDGGQTNSRRNGLMRNMSALTGLPPDSENVRLIIDEDAPYSFRHYEPRSRPPQYLTFGNPRAPLSHQSTLFSFNDGPAEAGLIDDNDSHAPARNNEKTRHRQQIENMPTKQMSEVFLKLYDGEMLSQHYEGSLPDTQYADAKRLCGALFTAGSVHSKMWMKKCEQNKCSMEGLADLKAILDEELERLDPNGEYDYRLEESINEEDSGINAQDDLP